MSSLDGKETKTTEDKFTVSAAAVAKDRIFFAVFSPLPYRILKMTVHGTNITVFFKTGK